MLSHISVIMLAALSNGGAALQAPPAPPAPPPPACTSPEHRQFDFWVGRWDVYETGTERLVAHSLIERLYAGCAIRENWMPLGGTGGGSLSTYRPDRREWRQIWVDSRNGWVEFRGGMEADAMVISGVWPNAKGPGTRPLVRMRYSLGEKGSVRQQGHSSIDEGASWQPYFDLTYKPRAAPLP